MTVVNGKKKTPMCFDILVFSTIKINVYIYICACDLFYCFDSFYCIIAAKQCSH